MPPGRGHRAVLGVEVAEVLRKVTKTSSGAIADPPHVPERVDEYPGVMCLLKCLHKTDDPRDLLLGTTMSLARKLTLIAVESSSMGVVANSHWLGQIS